MVILICLGLHEINHDAERCNFLVCSVPVILVQWSSFPYPYGLITAFIWINTCLLGSDGNYSHQSSHPEPLFRLSLSTAAILALTFTRVIAEEWALCGAGFQKVMVLQKETGGRGDWEIFGAVNWFGNSLPQKSLYYILQSGAEEYGLLKQVVTSSYSFTWNKIYNHQSFKG